MKKIVVFTGAGVSADSGLATFRDADGLWAEYRIEDVCTPEALARNRALVVEFYNRRRREMLDAGPNAGHRAIAALEERFEVEVITQNVDDLHERAGSTRVLHLHGELTCLRSERDAELIVPLDGWEQPLDARAPDGALLRPHIVFFGEAVPMFDRAKPTSWWWSALRWRSIPRLRWCATCGPKSRFSWSTRAVPTRRGYAIRLRSSTSERPTGGPNWPRCCKKLTFSGARRCGMRELFYLCAPENLSPT